MSRYPILKGMSDIQLPVWELMFIISWGCLFTPRKFLKNCLAVYIFFCLFPNEASLFSTEENNDERQLLSMSELTEVTFAYLNWENTYN